MRGTYAPCVRRCIRDEFLTSTAIWTAFFMAESEMVQVRARPDELLEKYRDKISLYYAVHDAWTPADYFTSTKKRHPQLKCKLLPQPIPHAFDRGRLFLL